MKEQIEDSSESFSGEDVQLRPPFKPPSGCLQCKDGLKRRITASLGSSAPMKPSTEGWNKTHALWSFFYPTSALRVWIPPSDCMCMCSPQKRLKLGFVFAMPFKFSIAPLVLHHVLLINTLCEKPNVLKWLELLMEIITLCWCWRHNSIYYRVLQSDDHLWYERVRRTSEDDRKEISIFYTTSKNTKFSNCHYDNGTLYLYLT